MQILKTSQSRVFLIEGRADPEFEPSYESQFKMLGSSQDMGTRNAEKIPDPSQPGRFVEISTTPSVSGRVSTTLEGYYARDLLSRLLELSEVGCPFDIQVHTGACLNPQVFNSFDKAIIFELAYNENWDVDQLTALGSDEREAVMESVQISARGVYEVAPLRFATKASATINDDSIEELIDVVYCDSIYCGSCSPKSNACQKAFSVGLVTDTFGVEWNRSTDTWSTVLHQDVYSAYVLYTEDDWETIYSHDLDGIIASSDYHVGIDCVGDYFVITSNISGALHYALLTSFDNGGAPSFTEITTGITGAPNDIYSLGRKAFVVGDSGYIYSTTDPTEGLTVEDAGVATSENLNRIHAISEQFAVAVGQNGVVVWTNNGSTWTLVEPFTSENIISLYIKSQYEWWVGSDGGNLYYSKDQGSTWKEKSFPGYNDGNVYDIIFATDSVAYLAHTTSGDVGRILRSFDGGYTWAVLPMKEGSLPTADKISRLAVCDDATLQTAANHIAGVGKVGSDGILVHGQVEKQVSTVGTTKLLIYEDGDYILIETGDKIIVD